MTFERPTCVICGTALTMHQSRLGVVCDRADCAWKHQSTPARLRCGVCQTLLTHDQVASGACAKPACRREWFVDRALRASEARRQQLLARATVFRDESAIAAGIGDAERYPVSLIPYNWQTTTPLPAWRRDALREHVTAMATRAQTHIREGTVEPVPPRTFRVGEPSSELASIFGAACGACRGRCCGTGGEHAYIKVDTMMGHFERHPTDSVEQAVEKYMAPIPTDTMENGCVYQFATGCALPRAMRSSTCNTYFCIPLVDMQLTRTEGDPIRAFFVPHEEVPHEHGEFVGGVFASAEYVHIVRRPNADAPAHVTASAASPDTR